MIAEDLQVLDADTPLWSAARPLLEVALQIERRGQLDAWHGWCRQSISAFLCTLPAHCSLVVGVWDAEPAAHAAGQEALVLGLVCEVLDGVLSSVRTFAALTAAGLKPVEELEPALQDARQILRLAKLSVAPVAWALFTDKTTWDEWLFAQDPQGGCKDKGELLAQYAHRGRCVLMGSQALHSYG